MGSGFRSSSSPLSGQVLDVRKRESVVADVAALERLA
jgi:hypothetical protein